jgi:hypothetical protein
MSDPTMTVVLAVDPAHHVLGAIAPVAAPIVPVAASATAPSGGAANASLPLAPLVGEGLLLWGGITHSGGDILVRVPAAQLKAVSVPLLEDLLRAPLSYAGEGTPSLQPALEVKKVTLAGSSLTLTLKSAPTAELNLWVLVAGADGTATAPTTGTLAAPHSSATLTLSTPAGAPPFNVLVLASGCAAWLGVTI